MDDGNGLLVKLSKTQFKRENDEVKWDFFYDCFVCVLSKMNAMEKTLQNVSKSKKTSLGDKFILSLCAIGTTAVIMVPVALACMRYINQLKSVAGG